jgi:hypothetical protein
MNSDLENNRLIIYQPEKGISTLEVRLEHETVWLTQNQMADLFQKDRSTISEHIKNVYEEKELDKNSTHGNFPQVRIEGGRKISRLMDYYSLDVIISVGYRVKSKRGTQFRIWANEVLKNHLLHQHAFSYRIEKIEKDVNILQNQIKTIDFQIRTELPPKEGLFFDGHVFDAYEKAVSFIKEARKSIILIDNFIDESVFIMLSKREKNVKTIIYTDKISDQLKLDLEKHNAQYEPIEIKLFKKSHDRFLIIDKKVVCHIGASLKDLGKKLFGFSKISIDPKIILDYLEKK